MRDKNLDPENFNTQIAKICRRNLSFKVLTEAVFVNPNLEYEIGVAPLPRRLADVRDLLIVSYYSPDEAFGIFVRAEVEWKILRNFSTEDKLQLEILLSGERKVVENYLLLNEEISERTFFGNMLPNGIRIFNSLSVRRRKLRKPTKSVYRRGYKDHGSRRPNEKWLPSYDYSFTEEFNFRNQVNNQVQQYLHQVLEILREL